VELYLHSPTIRLDGVVLSSSTGTVLLAPLSIMSDGRIVVNNELKDRVEERSSHGLCEVTVPAFDEIHSG
jgi:hypothetical protein